MVLAEAAPLGARVSAMVLFEMALVGTFVG